MSYEHHTYVRACMMHLHTYLLNGDLYCLMADTKLLNISAWLYILQLQNAELLLRNFFEQYVSVWHLLFN